MFDVLCCSLFHCLMFSITPTLHIIFDVLHCSMSSNAPPTVTILFNSVSCIVMVSWLSLQSISMLYIAAFPTLDALYNSALKPASPQPLSSSCPQEKGDSDIIMLVFWVFLIFKTVITSMAITSYATISPLSVRWYLLLLTSSKWYSCCSMQTKAALELFYLLNSLTCVLKLAVVLQASNSLHQVNLHNYKGKCPVCWVCTTN